MRQTDTWRGATLTYHKHVIKIVWLWDDEGETECDWGQKDFYRLYGKRNVVTGVEMTNVSTNDPGLILYALFLTGTYKNRWWSQRTGPCWWEWTRWYIIKTGPPLKISRVGGGSAAGTNGLLWNRLGDVKGWVNSHGLMTSLIMNDLMNLGVIFRNSTCKDKSWVERQTCLPTWWVRAGVGQRLVVT